jgi:transcriptional regulator with XRE-family HTH domain
MFGKRLKELRKKNELTQSDLARIINVSPSTIGMYERENRQPTVETLNHLANHFEVTVDYLLGRTNKRNFNKEKSSTIQIEKELSNKELRTLESIINAYLDSLDEK